MEKIPRHAQITNPKSEYRNPKQAQNKEISKSDENIGYSSF